MLIKNGLTLIGLIALTVSDAAGQTYAAGGAGNGSCGTWIADRRTPDGVSAMLDSQWILGFLSGIGFLGKVDGLDPLKGVDVQAVLAWIDNWCRGHPLSPIADAGGAFSKAHPD